MRSFAAFGGSLKTLSLKFSFQEIDDSDLEEEAGVFDVDVFGSITGSTGLKESISVLEVDTMIEIRVESSAEEHCVDFEDFVRDVARMKQWAMIPKVKARRGPRRDSWLVCSWILRPETAATTDKRPDDSPKDQPWEDEFEDGDPESEN